ncbi:hypothetical protein CDAR_182051 [Caerostris darwini]|uniref:Uncharacterized protein n=1 Tax=Caerostris darwini TaxID=1538125 RepID=A0AAV4MYQ8_9ARAC|nr:hypothetical protein CDAR_182051 [Caerostris darwini]
MKEGKERGKAAGVQRSRHPYMPKKHVICREAYTKTRVNSRLIHHSGRFLMSWKSAGQFRTQKGGQRRFGGGWNIEEGGACEMMWVPTKWNCFRYGVAHYVTVAHEKVLIIIT